MRGRVLTEKDLRILDVIVNLEPILKFKIYEFWFAKNKILSREEVDGSIDRLLNSKEILIEKDKYGREIITINPDRRGEVLSALRDFWDKRIRVESLLKIVRENEPMVLKFLESKTSDENKTFLFISDYYYQWESLSFCQKLWDIDMVFKAEWYSTRGYRYEEYYLRKIPVNVEEEIRKYIESRINVEDFRVDLEWRILLLPLFTDSPVNIKDIEEIFPNLTHDEVLELLSKLENKRALTFSGDTVLIPKYTKELIKNSFLLKKYSDFETLMIEQVRKRVGESISNLYLLGALTRLLMTSQVKVDGPFAIIEKQSIRNVDLKDLKEASKLGILFMTESKVIMAKKVLDELERLLRSRVFEKVIRIGANETYTAIVTWKKIFGEECSDYIKIQDEYVNEDTLRIIKSYSPPHIDITILTSIEGARSRDLDIEEMKRIVDEMKGSGKKLNLYFIGYDSGPLREKAPFHFRYIISRDVCYAISTSIKQVGKGKDADIISISREEKEGLIEPAFDYWVGLPRNKLKEKGIDRVEFEEWIKNKLSR